jgi:hypothetical protein
MSGATDNRFEDGVVAETGAHGGEISGSGTLVRHCDVSAARIHGLHVAGRDTPVAGVRIESCDIHHNGNSDDGRPVGDGIKIEVASGTIVRATRTASNTGNGILENDTAHATRIEDCTIEDNGTSSFAHGVYTKGEGGIIRGCRVRGNSGYGLHLWAAAASWSAGHRRRRRRGAAASPRMSSSGATASPGTWGRRSTMSCRRRARPKDAGREPGGTRSSTTTSPR